MPDEPMGPIESFSLGIQHLSSNPLSYQVDYEVVRYGSGEKPVQYYDRTVIYMDYPQSDDTQMIKRLLRALAERL